MTIDHIIDKIRYVVDTHRLENEGEYARFLWQNEEGNRKMGINEYGCADAANILYTIGDFPKEAKVREAFVRTLQSMQDKESGLFEEGTHHTIHTTAHCTAALELFDARPLYPFTALMKYKNKDELYALLDGLDWEKRAWAQSHQGAGIYAAFELTDNADLEWKKWYFDWLWENADPQTGFWKKDIVKQAKPYNYMGAAFHYLFNHENAHMPIRYPEKMIDSCIKMYEDGTLAAVNFGGGAGFLEVDWLYCINRASRQTAHRFDECKELMKSFGHIYVSNLEKMDADTHDGINDLHQLFGFSCALAELQQAVPGEFITTKPLRLALDRRPFI